MFNIGLIMEPIIKKGEECPFGDYGPCNMCRSFKAILCGCDIPRQRAVLKERIKQTQKALDGRIETVQNLYF